MTPLSGRVSGRALAAFLAVVALVPWLLPNAYLVHAAAVAGLYVIVATGLNLLMGYAGQVSLGHAGFYGLGAYVSGVLGARYGWSPWAGMTMAALATGALAWLVGIPTLKLRSYYLAMATLGIGIVLHLAFVQFYGLTGGSSGLAGLPPWDLGGFPLTSDVHHYYLIWGFAAVALALARNVVNSGVGRALRALGDSEVAAEAMGIDTAAEKRRIFVLSAIYASVAGSLYAHYITVISPEIFSFLFSVVLVLMVAVGGIGRFWGAVLGAVLLTTLPEALRRYGDWEVPLYGLVLVLVMMFMPHGLAGILARWTTRSIGRAPAPSPTAPIAVPGAAGDGEPAWSVAAASGGDPDRLDGVVPAAGSALLEVDRLSKDFGGLRAVSDCSFAVFPGEIKAVIGPNGAGKTTLFNVITGVYPPTGGEVRFRGQPITRWPPHRIARLGVSRTFQNLQLFPSLPVVENVMVGAHRHARAGFVAVALDLPASREDERRDRARALAALARVGLADAASLPAGSLPFGRQKLVEVARALAAEPTLLLLDEPAAGLNTTEKAEMMALIGRLRAGGLTIVIIEHDMRMVMSVSDRIVVLNYGQKIAEGTPAEVRGDRDVVKVYLGEEVEFLA